MKKILLLFSILIYCSTTYAQVFLNATPTTVVSGNSVTINPTTTEYAGNYISLLGFGIDPGTASIINMVVNSQNTYNKTTNTPTKAVITFSFKNPGAATQPLTFLLSYNTYYNNDISSTQNQLQGTIQITINPQTATFYNVAKSQTFYNNTCGTGQASDPYTAYVAAHTYSSLVSQADADSKATAWISANGQSLANANAPCKTIYYNAARTQSLTPVCATGYTYSGSAISYTVPANKYSSLISQADADAKAQNEINTTGQNTVNGNCVIIPQPIMSGPTTICDNGAMTTFSITNLNLMAPGTTITWTVGGSVLVGGAISDESFDIAYDPNNAGNTGWIRASLSNGKTVMRHFNIVTCP